VQLSGFLVRRCVLQRVLLVQLVRSILLLVRLPVLVLLGWFLIDSRLRNQYLMILFLFLILQTIRSSLRMLVVSGVVLGSRGQRSELVLVLKMRLEELLLLFLGCTVVLGMLRLVGIDFLRLLSSDLFRCQSGLRLRRSRSGF
jgi:hypothetical protein